VNDLDLLPNKWFTVRFLRRVATVLHRRGAVVIGDVYRVVMREAGTMRTATHGVLLVPKDDPRRALFVRMAGTFLQQPTLRLTLPQAQRLWNLDAKTCDEHLTELVGAHFLKVRDRQYQLTHANDVW